MKKCESFRNDISLYTMGALDPERMDEVGRHLASGCPSCAAELAECEAVAAHLPLALPAVNAPPSVRNKLLDRIHKSKSPAITPTVAKPPARSVGRVWAVAAAVALSCGVGITATWFALSGVLHTRNEQISTLEKQLRARNEEVQLLEGELKGARDTLVALNSRDLKVIALSAQEAQPASAWGRILWNQQERTWRVAFRDMKPAQPGKTYELWFVTAAGEKIAANTFDVNQDGSANLQVDLPGDIGKLALAAVTDEPMGGSEQPTGSFQLIGKIE